jgi:hypothetical protein
LVYLRARMYAPGMGRFLSRDTWGGTYKRPLSLNRWSYVDGNPVRFSDPSGLCKSCYLFLFPGIGSQGDIDRDGSVDLGRERNLKKELQSRLPTLKITAIYPFGSGLVAEPIQDSALYSNLVTLITVAHGLNSLPSTKADEINRQFNFCGLHEPTITFLGYSGGGQTAYSTAQALRGSLFIDNMVLLASPFRAHEGKGNIGHIWDLAWSDDPYKEQEKNLNLLDEDYNTDEKTFCSHHMGVCIHRDSTYVGGGKCTMYGEGSLHYDENNPGDYFETSTDMPVESLICADGQGTGFFLQPSQDKSRVEFLADFLINIVGVGREKK